MSSLGRAAAEIEVIEIALLDGRHREHDEDISGAELMINYCAVANIGAEAEVALDQGWERTQRVFRVNRFLGHSVHFDIALGQGMRAPWLWSCRIVMQKRQWQREALGLCAVDAGASKHHVAPVLEDVRMDAVP